MTVLAQLQLDQSVVNCGMSYVFILGSGAFFIIDGGYFTPGEDERLYRRLCSHCTGKPVIAGWFFSHAHQDHIGVFIDMMMHHRRDLEIRQLIFNFQPLELPDTADGWRIKSNDLPTVRKFYDVLAAYCADIPVVTPHTGDLLTFDELTAEVLYTWEDLDGPGNFNDHSTVIRAEVSGQKILFLGDINQAGSRVLLNSGKPLKSDIVQISHHGFSGASEALYRAVDAGTALWPTAAYCIPGLRERDTNRYLLDSSNIIEHIFNAEGTRELCLPYVPSRTGRP